MTCRNKKGNEMIEDYFCNMNTLHELRLGPIGKHIDAISEEFKSEGFSRGSARTQLQALSHLSRYMLWKGRAEIGDDIFDQIDDFVSNHLPKCNCNRSNHGKFVGVPPAMTRLAAYLTRNGIVTREEKPVSPDSIEGVLIRFNRYLVDVRALAPKSIVSYLHMCKTILVAREGLHGSLDLASMTRKDVIDIYDAVMPLHSGNDWKRSMTSLLRVFLRFIAWERVAPEGLCNVIPSVRRWTMAQIPKALTEDQLTQLIDTPDRKTADGARDYAILILLATLGMRASEIVALRFEDVHWRKRTIVIPGVKSLREREMPLADTAFRALYDYIKEARPQCTDRHVFLRHKAPIRAFKTSSAVTTIVTKHVLGSGIQRDSYRGAHLLRHTFATLLVNRGVSIKGISDMLGHASIDTTSIYGKVDLSSLRKLARPMPDCQWRP